MGPALSLCSGSSAVDTSADAGDEAGALRAKMRSVNWVPLESDPNMLNEFAKGVGLPDGWGFVDVLGVDADLLAMVPPGCIAVTLLFKPSASIGKYNKEQRERIEAQKQKVSPDLFFMKQYVGNACGTIACLHSMGNNQKVLGLSNQSALGRFLAACKNKTPDEAGQMLADASELHRVSEASAAGGQTEAPAANASVDCHFICFVEKDGDIYELDGNKVFPINHGPSGGDFLKKAADVVKTSFMDVDPDSMHFNLMALVKTE